MLQIRVNIMALVRHGVTRFEGATFFAGIHRNCLLKRYGFHAK